MSTPIFGLLPTGPEPEPGLTHATDHGERAVGVLIEILRDKARFTSLVKDYAKVSQELEDAFWALYSQRSIATAVGVQLDVLGRIVDELRNGLSDTDYRAILRIKGRVLRSKGTAVDLCAVTALMLNGAATFTYDEAYPATVVITILGTPGFTLSLLAKFLRKAKSAGVRLGIVAAPAVNAFRYGSTVAPATSAVFGYNDGHYGGLV